MTDDAYQQTLTSNQTTTSLTTKQLEDHLFECANIIRNTVDKTDYKDYILPLVFYKSLSDTFVDEYAQNLKEFDDAELARDAAFHDFQIPEGYLWEADNDDLPENHQWEGLDAERDLRSQKENVASFIDEAFSAIEEANPGQLDGVFRAEFMAEEALAESDGKLIRLIEHLSTHNLSQERLPDDMLGEAYMDLVRHFASEEGRDGGEFFTPPQIIRLMVQMLAPFEAGDTFHDPTCGSAGFLVEAAHHFREKQEGDPSKLRMTGQEVNPDIAAIAKMNLFLNGLNGQIRRQDSLSEPMFTEDDTELETFDYVLANFPFSANWDKDGLQDDPYGRLDWANKLPRADRGDYAFIMHIAKQLNDTGRAAIVVPNGVLFRKHEQRYREGMIKRELVEAIVSLPADLFQNNSNPTSILVLNKDKPAERDGEVLFINAADNHAVEEPFYRDIPNTNRNELTTAGAKRIADHFVNWTSKSKVSRAVDTSEIERNDFDLSISLYVDTTEPEIEYGISNQFDNWNQLREERRHWEDRLTGQIEGLESSTATQSASDTARQSRFWGSVPDEWRLVDGSEVYEVNPSYQPDEDMITYIEMDALDTELPHPKYYGERKASEYSGKLFSEGDTLFARITPCTENGKAAFVDEMPTRVGIGSTEYVVLSPNTGEILPWFLYYVAKSYPVQNYAISRMRGSTGRQRVPFDVFRRELKIALPPLEEQKRIASILYTADTAIQKSIQMVGRGGGFSNSRDMNGQLQQVKRSLMQKLLTGEVRTRQGDVDIVNAVTDHV
jgi:type I restriction enzyme M protein